MQVLTRPFSLLRETDFFSLAKSGRWRLPRFEKSTRKPSPRWWAPPASISHFMYKFRSSSFIDYSGVLTFHNSLLNIVVHT